MKRFHLNKRGEAEEMETLSLVDVILGLIVAAILIMSVLAYSNVSDFGKIYLKEELAMMMSTITSSNGHIEVKYPIGPDYRFSISNDPQDSDKIKILYDSTLLGRFKDKDIVTFIGGLNENPSFKREAAE